MFDLTQMGKWVNLAFVSSPGQDHFVCLPRLDLPRIKPQVWNSQTLPIRY